MNRRDMMKRVAAAGWWIAGKCNRAHGAIRTAITPNITDTSAGFQALEKPVSISIQKLNRPWKYINFRARCPSVGLPNGEIVSIPMKGLLIRLPSQEGKSIDRQFKAYSVVCPHEWCTLKLVTEMRDVVFIRARINRPVLTCPCHFSTYDPLHDGKLLVGPARRGAYRFRFHVDRETVIITDVEIDAARL